MPDMQLSSGCNRGERPGRDNPYEDGGDVVFNQQSLPGATTGQALLPENDKPVDAFAAIKAQKQAEPVIDGMILEEA